MLRFDRGMFFVYNISKQKNVLIQYPWISSLYRMKHRTFTSGVAIGGRGQGAATPGRILLRSVGNL